MPPHSRPMAFLDVHYETPAALDPDRNEVLGLALSALLPLAAVFAVAGLVAFLGLGDTVRSIPIRSRALFFVAALSALGRGPLVRRARRRGGPHRRAWVLALIGWGLVYPFIYGMADSFWLGLGQHRRG